jgi:hypothetical protein
MRLGFQKRPQKNPKKSEANEKALKVPRFFQRLFTPPIGDFQLTRAK